MFPWRFSCTKCAVAPAVACANHVEGDIIPAQGQRYNQQTYRTYAEAFTIAWQQLHPELAAAAAEAGPAAATKLLEDQYWCVFLSSHVRTACLIVSIQAYLPCFADLDC